RDGEPVAGIELGVGFDAVGARDLRGAETIMMRDAAQAFARLDDMHAAAGGCRRGSRAMRRARGHVARNDQTLAGLDLGRAAEAVGLDDGGGRNAVAPRDGVDGLTVADRDRRPAVPGPGAGLRS